MSLFDEIRKLTQPYDEDDREYYDDDSRPMEEEEEEEPTVVVGRSGRSSVRTEEPTRLVKRERRQENHTEEPAWSDNGPFAEEPDYPEPEESWEPPAPKRDERVVNIHTTTAVQVVLAKPERFDQAAEIADHLRQRRTVVINLETTNKDVARRLVDFLSGVAYANGGKIKKVAVNTYIITPYNVDIMGDLIDELENSGVSFY